MAYDNSNEKTVFLTEKTGQKTGNVYYSGWDKDTQTGYTLFEFTKDGKRGYTLKVRAGSNQNAQPRNEQPQRQEDNKLPF